MSILGRYKQQPGEKLKRLIDLKDWLETAEVISIVAVNVTPVTDPPLMVPTVLIDSGGKKFAYYVTGGLDGETYTITFTETTQTQIREDEVEIEVEAIS